MRLLRRKTGAAAIQPLGLRDEFKRRRSLGSVIRNANGLNGLGRLPKESVMKISSASKVLNNHYFPPPKEEMGKRKPRTKPCKLAKRLFRTITSTFSETRITPAMSRAISVGTVRRRGRLGPTGAARNHHGNLFTFHGRYNRPFAEL